MQFTPVLPVLLRPAVLKLTPPDGKTLTGLVQHAVARQYQASACSKHAFRHIDTNSWGTAKPFT